MTYPRIVVCQLTGVKAIVYSADDERRFHRDGLHGVMIALAVAGVCLVIGLLGLFT